MEAKRRRKLHTRSSAGCQTCRIRKIKCDENEPDCERCTSTGRRCDGVRSKKAIHFHHENHTNIKSHSSAIVQRINSYSWLIDSTEHHVFGFYLHRVAPFLSGSLDHGLWSTLIPQLAHHDDAVKYSILAVSEFFANPVKSPQSNELLNRTVSAKHLNAIQWYARALSAFRRNDFREFRSDLLAKTIMFVSLEIQQNNIAGGLRLLKLAFTMVAPLLTAGCVDSQIQFRPDDITETILPIFMRSAGMLFTPWNELHDRIEDSITTTELVEEVFWMLCMTWTLWKDFYLSFQEKADIAWSKSRERYSELQSALLITRGKLSAYHHQIECRLLQADVLNDYCGMGLHWLETMKDCSEVMETPQNILKVILAQLNTCRTYAATMYPAALRTVFFHQMAILPLAYMVAVFASVDEVRRHALALMDYSSVERPYTQLHAILLPPHTNISKSNDILARRNSSNSSKIMHTKINKDRTGTLLPRSNLISSTDEAATTLPADSAQGEHAQQSVWLTGDMLHVYPERRIVMTEIP